MKKALVVGGNSGVGLALVLCLLERGWDHVYIVGKTEPVIGDVPAEAQNVFSERTSFYKVNLIHEDYSVFDEIKDIDTLMITAGFGRVALFEGLTEAEISNIIKCNELGVIRIIKKYYPVLKSDRNFFCAVMGSIAGHVASPYFSVYSASKSGVCRFVEAINAELEAEDCANRILDVSPGSIAGTNFNGGGNCIKDVIPLANNIVDRMFSRQRLFIPSYDETYKRVLESYHLDREKFAKESYEYKKNSARISTDVQVSVGYLSGTFDLFHVGHLNLLKRAKEWCDYLIVGVHKSGAWKGKETYIPYEERVSILESIRYVDEVIEAFPEDSDAYDVYHIERLFVGSDYKGTERFRRYEEYFSDKDVEIIYFPYTHGTSSTQLREALKKGEKENE